MNFIAPIKFYFAIEKICKKVIFAKIPTPARPLPDVAQYVSPRLASPSCLLDRDAVFYLTVRSLRKFTAVTFDPLTSFCDLIR